MKTLLFIGDSITDSRRLFLDTPHSLGDGYVSMIQSRLLDSRYRIINRGHDGFTSTDILRCLERDCLSKKPDIITLLVGVNDIAAQLYGGIDRIPGEFEAVYRQILLSLEYSSLKQFRQSLWLTDIFLSTLYIFYIGYVDLYRLLCYTYNRRRFLCM